MYTQLNKILIFVVIGIAAANIFVFYDAWTQSEHIKIVNENMFRRMAYSWKRASKAMAVTCSTTAVAFGSNGLSPIIPFRAFGINAAIIILVNYALTIMIMPSLVIVHDKCFKGRCCLCTGQNLSGVVSKLRKCIGLLNCCKSKKKEEPSRTLAKN